MACNGQKFSVIYADPPWRFATYSAKGLGRSADAHYSCMPLADIKALDVGQIAGKDCALFLWVTAPMLQEGIEVLKVWGFKYKSIAFVWAKTTIDGTRFPIGTGYWTRANPELCLLGIRGKPKRVSCNVRQLVVSLRREHSRKPDRVRDDIVKLMGDVPRIELFARSRAPGWDAWGNQTEKFGGAVIEPVFPLLLQMQTRRQQMRDATNQWAGGTGPMPDHIRRWLDTPLPSDVDKQDDGTVLVHHHAFADVGRASAHHSSL